MSDGKKLRRLLVALAAIAFLVAVASATPASAGGKKADKATVCHITGNGNVKALSVNGNAVQAHLNHGDALPGDPIPGEEGKEYGDDCEPVCVGDCQGPNDTCIDDENCCSGICLDFGVKFCA